MAVLAAGQYVSEAVGAQRSQQRLSSLRGSGYGAVSGRPC